MRANFNFNFDLSGDISLQLENFQKAKKQLENMGISFSNSKVSSNVPSVKEYTIGENEAAWLAFSGKSRMNMRDKTLSREAQAAAYLTEKGLDVPNKDFDNDHSVDSQNDDDGGDISDTELFDTV